MRHLSQYVALAHLASYTYGTRRQGHDEVFEVSVSQRIASHVPFQKRDDHNDDDDHSLISFTWFMQLEITKLNLLNLFTKQNFKVCFLCNFGFRLSEYVSDFASWSKWLRFCYFYPALFCFSRVWNGNVFIVLLSLSSGTLLTSSSRSVRLPVFVTMTSASVPTIYNTAKIVKK